MHARLHIGQVAEGGTARHIALIGEGLRGHVGVIANSLEHCTAKGIGAVVLVGGFLDAAGGGGWGPVVTSNLLVQGAEPRKVVGTVNSVEFFLTLTISAAFIFHIGIADLAGPTLGLLIGGIIAAPFGAMAAKHFSPKLILVLVGIVLSITSSYGIWKAWG